MVVNLDVLRALMILRIVNEPNCRLIIRKQKRRRTLSKSNIGKKSSNPNGLLASKRCCNILRFCRRSGNAQLFPTEPENRGLVQKNDAATTALAIIKVTGILSICTGLENIGALTAIIAKGKVRCPSQVLRDAANCSTMNLTIVGGELRHLVNSMSDVRPGCYLYVEQTANKLLIREYRWQRVIIRSWSL